MIDLNDVVVWFASYTPAGLTIFAHQPSPAGVLPEQVRTSSAQCPETSVFILSGGTLAPPRQLRQWDKARMRPGAGQSYPEAAKITSVYCVPIGEIRAFRLRLQGRPDPPNIFFPKVLDIDRRGAISLGAVRTRFERHRLASHPAPSQHMVRDRRSPTHPTVACCLIFRCVVAQVD
jgi:hypothetical protein